MLTNLSPAIIMLTFTQAPMIDHYHITPADFITQLGPACLVLMPNRRLATRLRQNLLQTLGPGDCLRSPTILAYQDWIDHCFKQLYLQGKIPEQPIDDLAFTWFWHKTLPEDSAGLVNPERLATLAKQAWQLAHEGNLDWQSLLSHPHKDYQWFASWATQVSQALQTEGYLDNAHFITRYIQTIAQLASSQYTRIYWYGFMDFSVQQKHLQRALETYLLHQTIITPKHTHGGIIKPTLMAAASPEHELNLMLTAAKTALESGVTHIACVIPKLAHCRATIVTQVWQLFYPNTPWPSYDVHGLVNISGGYYLAELGPIQTAVALIRLWQQPVAYQTLATLLLSPYWGACDRLSIYAHLESIWRQQVAEQLPLALWLSLLPESHPGTLYLREQLEPLINQARQLPKSAYPSDWTIKIKQQLQDMHWPGFREQDSWHYQVNQQCLKSLDKISCLDSILGELTLTQYLFYWEELLAKQLFQAETQGQTVEILGVLEATGLTWDWLWVSQLQSQDFPETPRPNPFLPLSWQQAAGLPHSDAKREQLYAEQLLETWQTQSQQLTLSYSQMQAGMASEASLLLDAFQPAEIVTPEPLQYAPIALEPITETLLPPLQQALPGGSYHLQSFVNCPFQAYARYRLDARSLTSKSITLNAWQRGIAAHRCLQIIWQQLGSQAALLALSEDDRQTQIAKAARTALLPFQHQLSSTLWEQQHAWLIQVVTAWLDIEAERAPFIIHALEQQTHLTLDDLTISLRIDRIDAYEDKLLVLDYKTGTIKLKACFEEPLADVQMPLYLLAVGKAAAGFAYISLKPGMVDWDGVAEGLPEDNLKAFSSLAQTDAATQIGTWRNTLIAISQDCAQNQAPVLPRKPEICSYCDLASLCRLQEG